LRSRERPGPPRPGRRRRAPPRCIGDEIRPSLPRPPAHTTTRRGIFRLEAVAPPPREAEAGGRPLPERGPPRHLIGGGTPSAWAASAGSHAHTSQAWRKADRANSNARACGSGLSRISSQSSTYSPSRPSQRAAPALRLASAKPSGVGYGRWIGRPPREEIDRKVERPPPGVDRSRPLRNGARNSPRTSAARVAASKWVATWSGS
jgi:hypothetical protein